MKTKKMLMCAFIFSLVLLFFIPRISKADSASASKYIQITVCSGDTLWSIATDYGDRHSDVRKFVYDIKKANKLKSCMLYPGEELQIPCD